MTKKIIWKPYGYSIIITKTKKGYKTELLEERYSYEVESKTLNGLKQKIKRIKNKYY